MSQENRESKESEIDEKPLAEKLLNGELEEVELEKPVIECVDEFLRPYSKRLEPVLKFGTSTNKLDFLLMKRFLYTAYNNLLEMDLMMSNPRVLTSKNRLDEIQKQYTELQLHMKKPIDISYERIFLAAQKNYAQLKKEVISKKRTAELYKARAKSIEFKMKNVKTDAEDVKKKDKGRYEKLMKEYRALNGKYTDYIHNMATLRDQIVALKDYILNFEAKYKIQFSQIFSEECMRISTEIIKVLDGIAYNFDLVLWGEAKGSRIIRKFFEDANIEGSFSSKTYLKYYLKNISSDSKNEEHQELKKLLEYLEKFNTFRIYILGIDSSSVIEDRVLLEASSKEYNILGSNTPDKLFIEAKRHLFDLVIIDYEIKHEDAISLVESFWENYPETKNQTKILMKFRHPTYDDLDRAGKIGIRFFHRYDPMNKKAFAKKISEILA